nr:hypothetical protein [Nocardia brasiliensis]
MRHRGGEVAAGYPDAQAVAGVDFLGGGQDSDLEFGDLAGDEGCREVEVF